ncbi:cation transporter [Pseudomonas sp. SZMC_28357]|uniref:heavy-metal-associated domain-containing protein n=1 Tax=Pseudomonas sp. SZMC_28357 TaxID=3074380 RepID=UPI0028725CB8|nr:cation transporter [Pseudomonas sp. SZMC_28357]MDR9751572.1 cation transporter [Pseudomonas sp. SZMC_28357]
MQVFNVEGMSCGHCVKAITNAIQGQDFTAEVRVDLAAGEVRVDSQLSAEQLIDVISEEGYGVKRA